MRSLSGRSRRSTQCSVMRSMVYPTAFSSQPGVQAVSKLTSAVAASLCISDHLLQLGGCFGGVALAARRGSNLCPMAGDGTRCHRRLVEVQSVVGHTRAHLLRRCPYVE